MSPPVFFYVAAISQLTKMSQVSQKLLNSEDRQRFERIKSPRRANQLLAGRGLIQLVLAQQFGLNMGQDYRIEQYRVWHQLSSGRRFFLSLSHSRDRVALLISEQPLQLGVDVEYGKPRVFHELIEQVASQQERQAFASADVDKDYFYQLWTTKEAWFKMTGLTMGEIFRTNFHPLYGRQGMTRWQQQDYFYRHFLDNNYYYSICCNGFKDQKITLKMCGLVESDCTFL